MNECIALRGLEQGEAVELLGRLGARPREARRLWCRAFEPSRLDDLALEGPLPQVRQAIVRAVWRRQAPRALRRLSARVDPGDGFEKILFALERGGQVEAVRIPIHGRHAVVCVSSQTGCALGCAFCATARIGAGRNLLAEEMVEQVLEVQRSSPLPVKGVLFMGMGEPLANLQAVLKAARILSTGGGPGIAGDAITISTAGLLPGLAHLEAVRVPFRLILSVGAAIPEKRARLMPIEATSPLAEVFPAALRVAAARRRRLTLAYVMVSGVNTGAEDARALAQLVGGARVIIDLIDVNDTRGLFSPPDAKELAAFRDALQVVGAPVVRRYSGGQRVEAGCGMLAGTG